MIILQRLFQISITPIFVFDFFVFQQENIVQIEQLPLFLHFDQLGNAVPFSVQLGNQGEVLRESLFDIGNIDLALQTLPPNVNITSAVVADIAQNGLFGLLSFQNFVQFELPPVDVPIEGLGLLPKNNFKFVNPHLIENVLFLLCLQFF